MNTENKGMPEEKLIEAIKETKWGNPIFEDSWINKIYLTKFANMPQAVAWITNNVVKPMFAEYGYSLSSPESSVVGEGIKAFINWFAANEFTAEGGLTDKIILCDGDYYWESDNDGDHPLSEEELYKLFRKSSVYGLSSAATMKELADKWVFETNGHNWSNNNNEAGDNYGSFIAGYKAALSNSPEQIEAEGLDYPAAARVVHLYLKEFCNEDLFFPDMIADAARKASAELEKLKAEQIEKGEVVYKKVSVENGKRIPSEYIYAELIGWLKPVTIKEDNEVKTLVCTRCGKEFKQHISWPTTICGECKLDNYIADYESLKPKPAKVKE